MTEQPGCDAVACYREVPLGQEDLQEDGAAIGADTDADGLSTAVCAMSLKAPANGSSLSMLAGGKAGSRGAGHQGARWRRGGGAVSGSLKPRM